MNRKYIQYVIDGNLCKCLICNKCYKLTGIHSHIRLAHTEEGKLAAKTRKVWNRGLSKKDNIVIQKHAANLRNRYKNKELIPTWTNLKHTKEQKDRISNTIKNKIKEGTWHYSFSKTRTHVYNGINFYGMWELQYAKWLDKNKINWYRPNETFSYMFENVEHQYKPDFYLIDSEEFVEIKGYETEKDRCKWKHFPLKLKILNGIDLFDLKIISEDQYLGKK